jgi:hypothetical protein
MFEWIIYSGFLECCLLVILLLGIATDPYSTGEIILWGLTALLGFWAIGLLLSIIEIVLENPLLLVLAWIFWKLYDEWNHPFRYIARRLPHQPSSAPKKKAKKKPAKKKAKKKEDPGPPRLVRRKGKLPSASSVLKQRGA